MENPNQDYIKRALAAVTASLTPDLLKKRYRDVAAGRHRTFGHCYVASEAVWYLLGDKRCGYGPHVLRTAGGTHWFLKHKETSEVLDPTAEQFTEPVCYENAVRCPFLTPRPSNRAAIIIERAHKWLSQNA